MRKVRVPPHVAEVIRAVHAEGGCTKDVAERTGYGQSRASQFVRALGIKLKHGSAGKPRRTDVQQEEVEARAREMAALYIQGETLEQIGQHYGITRERVRQILKEFTDVTAEDGGGSVQTQERRQQALVRRDARSWEKWGCSWADYKAIPDSAKRKYASQRNRALQRGIEWQFTLAAWWGLWRASGKWHLRGRGQGYVMCRYGDGGPYSPTNVFIAPAVINNSERRDKKSGLPRGVSRKENGNYRAFAAHRMIGGRRYYLGSFKTPEEAHSAYLLGPQPEQMRKAA